jgi:hypothetical protein
MKKLIAFIFCLLFSCAAQAQQPIIQSGFATPGHALYFLTNGVAADAGTAASGFLTSIGVTAQGPGICQNSAPITGPYNQICLVANSSGTGGLTFTNFGGVATAFTISVNGVVYQFPFTGSGTIGPPSTTLDDFACWNNTVGTLLSDCKIGPSSTTLDDFACWNNTVGTLLSDCKIGPSSTTVGDIAIWNNTVGTLLKDVAVLPIANGGIGAATATANLVFSGPTSGSPAAPSFRALVGSDLPATGGLGFRLNKNGTSQTGLTNGAYNLVTWSNSAFNTTGQSFTSSTWTASQSGLVQLSAAIWCSSHCLNTPNSDNPIVDAKFIKNSTGVCNGTDVVAVVGAPALGGSPNGAVASLSVTDQATAGDVYELCFYYTSDDSGNDGVLDGNPAHTWWSAAYLR